MKYIFEIARVAELVYAHDLKSCLVRDVGSIPTSGTDKVNADSHLLEATRTVRLSDRSPSKASTRRVKNCLIFCLNYKSANLQ